MSNSKKKPGEKSEGLLTKVLGAIIVALVAGGSVPWWWHLVVQKPVVSEKRPVEQVISPECSPEILKSQLLRTSARAAVIKTTAATMKEKLSQEQFECVSNLANVLLEQDGSNGHGLYFQGEAWRFKAGNDPKQSLFCRDRKREFFLRYITNEHLLSQSERDGDGNTCYDREKGYCKERTAWINHLMAVEYRQWAEDAKERTTKLKRLEIAAKFLKVDLDFGGFDLVAPSAALKETINEDFEKLGARYPEGL